jgi:Tfp pilus assembly protein PilF
MRAFGRLVPARAAPQGDSACVGFRPEMLLRQFLPIVNLPHLSISLVVFPNDRLRLEFLTQSLRVPFPLFRFRARMTVSPELAITPRLSRVRPAGLVLAVAVVGTCGCNSMSGHANNQIGMWNYRQGNYAAARVEFSRAVADDPLNASFAYNLACTVKHQGDPAGAEQNYLRAVQLDSNYQPAYHGLALLMNEEGRRLESLQLISTWAATHPHHPGAQIELAWIERQNGDNLASEQALYRALALDPGNPVATAQLGQLYQETGQNERALAMYERSMRGNWMQPDVQSRMASLRNSSGFVAGTPTAIAANPGGFPVAAYPTTAPAPLAAGLSSWPTVTSQRNDDPAHL